MGTSVNRIPSINAPLVDKQGRITPIWHEFLRSFIAKSVEVPSAGGNAPGDDIVAGPGLTETEDDDNGDRIFAVGAGSGLAVNANDVSIDINGQTKIPVALDDEIMFSDANGNNSIQKTTFLEMGNLIGGSPGGSDTQMQYNNLGRFAGDTGFTTDGAGNLAVVGSLLVDNITINGTELSTSSSSNLFTFSVPAGSAQPHYTFTQSGAASSSMPISFKCLRASVELNLDNDTAGTGSVTSQSAVNFVKSGTVKWSMGLTGSSSGSTFTLGTTALNAGNVFTVDATNRFFAINTALTRSVTAGITASTTQTQGQGALTAEINAVATVANANDTVTLPVAVAGRYCLVINNGANTLKVYPASGDDLGAGVDTSTTIATTSRKMFIAFDSTNWEPVI